MQAKKSGKMRKYGIIIAALVVVVAAALFLAYMPERIEGTMTVSAGNGETAKVDFDILYFSNFFLPSYVKGTLSVDGIEYTDQYTKLKEFPSVSDNRLFPSAWWKEKASIPYNMTFIKFDCADVNTALLNRINVLDIVLDKGVRKIHYVYMDESNQIDRTIEGISFWGPAQNAGEAEQIAESFGYRVP